MTGDIATETQKLDGIATQTASLSKNLDRAQTLLEVKAISIRLFLVKMSLDSSVLFFYEPFYNIYIRFYFVSLT